MTPGPAPEDDRTVIPAATVKLGDGEGGSRLPGSAADRGHTLPLGTRLEDLEITGLIGEGGFGIVYLAYDASLQRKVAIKEYMPSSLATRAAASFEVSVRSEQFRETFEMGLRSFVNEARLLARFDHPALLKVFRFWEANRTAYMAMPFYEGPTLKHALAGLGAPPPEAQLRAWLRPLLDALSVMHKAQCFHRDIAPDNILLTDHGPLLLDFGAARRVIGDRTHALTVVLKPGYAPIEQYGESASMTQGPWTDLYALASVLHFAITGRAPIASVERVMGDRLEPLAVRAAGRYGEGFLKAIDTTLAVHPRDRPQDVQQFRELLNAGLAADSPDLFHASGFQSSGFHSSGFSPSSFDAALLDLAPPPAVPPSVPPTVLPTLPPTRPWRGEAAGREPATAMLPEPAMATRDAAPGVTHAAVRFGKTAYAVLALALLTVALLVVLVRGRETPRIDPAPAATEPPSAVAPPVVWPATREPPAAAPLANSPGAPTPPAVEVAPSPVTATRVPAATASAPAATTPKRGPVPTPVEAATKATPAETPPDRPARAAQLPRRAARSAAIEPSPPKNAGGRPARCSDILQKASLESLTDEEAAYLRRECR